LHLPRCIYADRAFFFAKKTFLNGMRAAVPAINYNSAQSLGAMI
jgi:hypothetical protein